VFCDEITVIYCIWLKKKERAKQWMKEKGRNKKLMLQTAQK